MGRCQENVSSTSCIIYNSLDIQLSAKKQDIIILPQLNLKFGKQSTISSFHNRSFAREQIITMASRQSSPTGVPDSPDQESSDLPPSIYFRIAISENLMRGDTSSRTNRTRVSRRRFTRHTQRHSRSDAGEETAEHEDSINHTMLLFGTFFVGIILVLLMYTWKYFNAWGSAS